MLEMRENFFSKKDSSGWAVVSIFDVPSSPSEISRNPPTEDGMSDRSRFLSRKDAVLEKRRPDFFKMSSDDGEEATAVMDASAKTAAATVRRILSVYNQGTARRSRGPLYRVRLRGRFIFCDVGDKKYWNQQTIECRSVLQV